MKQLLILSLFVLGSHTMWAQQTAADRAKMEKERQAIQKELSEIQGVYNKVKGQKKETIGQLNLLQKKMNLQNQYIGNISKEIKILNDDIYLSAVELNKLQRNLDTLKAQYAHSVVYAYRNRSTYDYLNFIFSANTFNDALRRITYLKAYRSYREKQVTNIKETQQMIADRRQQMLGKQTQKKGALQNQTAQLNELEDQKKEKDAVVNKLKSKESELSKQIAEKRKKDIQLKNSIAAIIRREIEARRKAEAAEAERRRKEKADADALAKRKADEARATAKNNPSANVPAASKNLPEATVAKPETKKPAAVSSSIPLNDAEVKLSAGFAGNKGKLPWPVDNGYVSIHYGPYEIPGTKLKDVNQGITISTSVGSTAKAVFDGEVLAVFNLGDGLAVMISHGKYFTVYSNLSSASVSKGSMVRTGQSIGRVGINDDGSDSGKLDFIIMVEKNNVNPEPWLRNR